MGAVAPGTPGWIDLGSPDPEASRRFYSALFGWTANVASAEFGGYTIFKLDGKSVAGAGPLFSEGQPTAWSTYVVTDDADAVAAKVEAAGGKVLMPPGDVGENGRMGVFMDRAGAPFSVWQPGTMPGGELFNQPGALCWNELATRDPDGAKEFYGAVFGWGHEDGPAGDFTYTQWTLDGKSIGGMMPMTGDQSLADVPPHWLVYFAVDDCDATVDKVRELGGNVLKPAFDMSQGRMAVVQDPHGAVFAVIKM